MFNSIARAAKAGAEPRRARWMSARCIGFAAVFIVATLSLTGVGGSSARAQPAANQQKQADTGTVARQQARLQVDIQQQIRELSQRAERYLAEGDCDRFYVLYDIIARYTYRDASLIKGDFLYRSRQISTLESYQRYGEAELTDYQLDEVRKYAENRQAHLDQKRKSASCGKQANSTGWAIIPGTPINRPCISDRSSEGTTLRSRFASEDNSAERRERLRREAGRAFARVDGPTNQVLVECVITEISNGAESVGFTHTSYLGSSSGGVDRLGLLKVGEWMPGASGDWNTQVHFGSASPLGRGFVEFGVFGASAHEQTVTSWFDPGAGASLPIAGPNGGASGFLLGGWPLNVATGLYCSATLNDFGTRFGYGKSFQLTASTTLTPKIFASYSHTNFSESLSGSIPGFGRDFRYFTDVEISRFGLGISLGGETRLSDPVAVNGWDVTLRYASEFAGFKMSGSGQDNLDFTGFSTSTQALDKNEGDWGFKLSAGLGIRNRQGLSLGFDGSYERRPGYSEVVRNGTDPSYLQFNSAGIWTVKGYIRVQLGDGRVLVGRVDPDDDYFN
jgi:hypothetical protein